MWRGCEVSAGGGEQLEEVCHECVGIGGAGQDEGAEAGWWARQLTQSALAAAGICGTDRAFPLAPPATTSINQ